MRSLVAFANGGLARAWSALPMLLLPIVLIASNNLAPAQAQQLQRLSASQQGALLEKLNESTLLIAATHPTTSYFAMAHEIATLAGRDEGMRLLPLSGEGGLETLRNLVFLRGVDLAIVPANALARARETEALGPGLPQRAAYVTRLYNEEVHLLAGADINTFNDLRGKKVAVPLNDGNALFTLRDLLEHLDVNVVKMPAAEALSVVRSGEIAAVLLVGSKPMPLVAEIPKDGSIRLLNVPFTRALEEGYGPAAFRADDYPSLVPSGVVVESLAVSAVLLAHAAKDREGSWQRVSKFIPVFFGALSEHPLLNRHSGWGQVNIAATLPGWPRLPAADEWLRTAQQEQALALQKSFETFLRERQPAGSPELTAGQRKRLFDEFVRWTRKSVSEAGSTAR